MTSQTFKITALPFEVCLSIEFDKIWDYIKEDNNSNWTSAVKKIMSQEAKSMGENLKVAASGLELSDCTEWLYDFVCYENQGKNLKNVILVAESEWRGPFTNDYLQDIQDDFEKLILARCQYRLMIFEGESEVEIKESILHLIKIVKDCKLTKIDDRYMFAGWIKSKEFYFDLYIH